ncbi:hypothetical protein RTBOTA2_006927 [Rhodotorula toruloides]|nr:hypothetical protein RTBOTA2_006927 [Rhodotorula toruloides]
MEHGPDARQAARHVEQCRQRDFPEAFREGRAQPERREVESLAKEIVEKIAQFDQQMKEEAKGHERAHDALLHARSYLRLDLLPDFWLELKKRIGDARYEHFKSQVDKLPIGAVWSFADSEEEESLTKASIGAREGGYRRARIYGM